MTATQYATDHWSRRDVTDAGLERYLRDNRAPYNAAKAQLLEQLLGDVRDKSLLDYGGGAGYFGLRCALRGARVTLVDPADTALALGRRLATSWGVDRQLQTVCADSVPDFGARRFDIVVLKDVIEHVHDDAGLLARAAALQDAGGRLLISTHNQWSLNYAVEGSYHRWWLGEPNWLGWDPTHVRWYSPRTLRALLRRAGYGRLRWASVYLVPYDIASWATLLRRKITWPWLSRVDTLIGRTFPFSLLGWNVLVRAEKLG